MARFSLPASQECLWERYALSAIGHSESGAKHANGTTDHNGIRALTQDQVRRAVKPHYCPKPLLFKVRKRTKL